MTPAIAIVDFGAGNITSVARGLAAAGARVSVAGEPREIAAADGLVIPGVGHFAATAALDGDWRRAILAHAAAGRPLLGICLGMQWLFEGSDEAPDVPGLGLLAGRCMRLRGGDVKVPHVGWNRLERTRASVLLNALSDPAFAYFTHTYAVSAAAPDVVAVTSHGEPFAAAVERDRVFGTQYHPEKSGAEGLRQLASFAALAIEAPRRAV